MLFVLHAYSSRCWFVCFIYSIVQREKKYHPFWVFVSSMNKWWDWGQKYSYINVVRFFLFCHCRIIDSGLPTHTNPQHIRENWYIESHSLDVIWKWNMYHHTGKNKHHNDLWKRARLHRKYHLHIHQHHKTFDNNEKPYRVLKFSTTISLPFSRSQIYAAHFFFVDKNRRKPISRVVRFENFMYTKLIRNEQQFSSFYLKNTPGTGGKNTSAHNTYMPGNRSYEVAKKKIK